MLVIELTKYNLDGDIYDQGFYRDDRSRMCSDIKFATRLDKCRADEMLSDHMSLYPYTSYRRRLIKVQE